MKFSVAQLPYDAGADDPRGWMWLGLSIVVLALLASGVGIHNGFAYDDRWIIVQNANAHSLNRPWELFGTTYWPTTRRRVAVPPAHDPALRRRSGCSAAASPFLVPPRKHLAVRRRFGAGAAARPAVPAAQRRMGRGGAVRRASGARRGGRECRRPGRALDGAGAAERGAASTCASDRAASSSRAAPAVAIVALYVAGMLIKENAIVLPALLVIAEAVARPRHAALARARGRTRFPCCYG